jgi:hypothetical protein
MVSVMVSQATIGATYVLQQTSPFTPPAQTITATSEVINFSPFVPALNSGIWSIFCASTGFGYSFQINISNTGTVLNTSTGRNFCTIQSAIDDPLTINGNTIEVDPGYYSESITINKSIHLRGKAGEVDNTFIMPPAGLPASSSELSSIIIISGAGVSAEISGLTIKGPGPSGCGSIGRGIFVRDGAYANIHDNKILDIRDNPFSGCQNGIAIQVGRNAWSTSGTATIANNLISGYQKGAIVVDKTGSSATILNNTITGAGVTMINGQNGIQISRGATATLTGNTITGNSFQSPGHSDNYCGTGILLYENGAVAMTGGNIISGNDQNINIYGSTGALTLGEESFGSSAAPATFGYHIANPTNFNIDASLCTFEGISLATASLTQLFAIEDRIWHSVDDPTKTGFVKVKAGNVYLTRTETGAHIQYGIDAAVAGDVVHIQAGDYGIETAANRSVYAEENYLFGLFIDKANLTVRGYKASDEPVSSASEAAVLFQTGADAGFGPSGVFVKANGVTLEGLKLGDNIVGGVIKSNKTVEVIGDAFTINKCFINTSSDEGALYLGVWDAAHPIESYGITENIFNNALVSINNGVGVTGDRTSRVITNNTFTGVATPYLIGFRGWIGANPVQGWIVNPVGGAVVTGNIFNNTGVENYIMARGNEGGYDNSQFNWAEIWNSNTYRNHVVTLSDEPNFIPETYKDFGGYPKSRRISPLVQENVTIGQTGDVVLVSKGTYPEKVEINNSVMLKGPNVGINPNTGSRVIEAIIDGENARSGFLVAASNVKIDGFRIINCGGTEDAAIVNWGIQTEGTQILNNIITNNRVGILETRGNWLIKNNLFDGNNLSESGAVAGAGIYTDFPTDGMIIENNVFSNHTINNPVIFGATLPENHKNLLFKNNQLNEVYGVYCVGVDNSLFVENNFTMNSIDEAGTTCLTFGGACDNNTVQNNFFVGTHRGLRIADHGYSLGDNSAIIASNNSFSGFSEFTIGNLSGYTGAVSAECNWFGTLNGNTIATKLNGNVDYSPWLINGTDNNTNIGFQPVPDACGGTPVIITSAVATNQTCDGLGTIVVTFNGGAAPYSISWGGTPVTGSSPYTISDLDAGNYDITVTDANSSSDTESGVTVGLLPVKNVQLDAYYATIAEAITAASDFQTIKLCAGNYTEILDITKYLTIEGPNVGIDPNGATLRVPEAVILDGKLNIMGSNSIRIDGIKIRQTNDSLHCGCCCSSQN